MSIFIAILCIISIHAPARGATAEQIKEYEKRFISIHAPARGATSNRRDYFHASHISIHAPARGATDGRLHQQPADPISIHAPARGATSTNAENAVSFVFQSTLPRGERLGAISSKCSRINYFNPRSREGSDGITGGIC